MTFKILPQLVLKTIKEFRNVLYLKHSTKNQDDNHADIVRCNTYKYKSQHSKSGSNETNAKRTLDLLPVTLTILPVILAVYCEPEKPPPMRYTELPLYDSPHSNYKEKQASVHQCQKFKQKIIQSTIQPYVKRYRCIVTKIFDEIDEWFTWTKCQVTNAFEAFTLSAEKFVSYMRDDKNLDIRKAVVAVGTATGFVFGSRNYYLSRNLSFGVLAALFTGWLCFPKETDILIRDCSYYIATNIVDLINNFCGANRRKIKLERRDRLLPCLKDVCEPTIYSKERLICKHYDVEKESAVTKFKVTEKHNKVSEEHLKEQIKAEEDDCLVDDID